jgi:hypothetical protein
VESIDARELEISQQHAGDELAKHGGLPEPHTDVSSDLGRGQDQRQCEKNVGNRIHGCIIPFLCASSLI